METILNIIFYLIVGGGGITKFSIFLPFQKKKKEEFSLLLKINNLGKTNRE